MNTILPLPLSVKSRYAISLDVVLLKNIKRTTTYVVVSENPKVSLVGGTRILCMSLVTKFLFMNTFLKTVYVPSVN
jgi:hypothetical protein